MDVPNTTFEHSAPLPHMLHCSCAIHIHLQQISTGKHASPNNIKTHYKLLHRTEFSKSLPTVYQLLRRTARDSCAICCLLTLLLVAISYRKIKCFTNTTFTPWGSLLLQHASYILQQYDLNNTCMFFQSFLTYVTSGP